MTLLPGDVILTGTPSGIGPIESDDTTVAYWVGRAPTFPDFAQEFTDYFEQATKGGTPEAGIEESMLNCRTELSRSGFLVQ